MEVRHHEVFIHGFINIASLTAELDVLSQSEQCLDFVIA